MLLSAFLFGIINLTEIDFFFIIIIYIFGLLILYFIKNKMIL